MNVRCSFRTILYPQKEILINSIKRSDEFVTTILNVQKRFDLLDRNFSLSLAPYGNSRMYENKWIWLKPLFSLPATLTNPPAFCYNQ